MPRHRFLIQYSLAHRAIADTDAFFREFSAADAPQRFAGYWADFGMRFEPAERVAGDGLAVWHRPLRAGVLPLIALTFPKAQSRGDSAFMVAVRADAACRVFCLERSESPEQSQPIWMLVEVTSQTRAIWDVMNAGGLARLVDRVLEIVADRRLEAINVTQLPAPLATLATPPPAHVTEAVGARAAGSLDLSQVIPILKGASGDVPAFDGSQIRMSAVMPQGTVSFRDEDMPLLRPFTADILIAYVFDLPNSLLYLTRKDLALLGLTQDQLHDVALGNLARRLSANSLRMSDLGDGMFGFSCGGTYEASLLLLDSLWDQLAGQFPGMLLATAPARDLLFAIGSKHRGSVERIKKSAEVTLAEPSQAVSRTVLCRDGGRWQRSRL